MADNNTLARPYAEAIFEVARENQALGALSEALAAAESLLADGQVATFLSRPALSDEERLKFLSGLFAEVLGEGSVFGGGSRHGTNFLKLLIENGRVGVLPEIAEHFEALRADVENTVDVVVTSAAALSDDQQREIVAALTKRLGREVRLQTEIDKNLIGGAVISAGDVVIDGSLRARLDGLTNALVN
jgi:F-type H+-transporting ATPase subunit delta